MSWRFYPLKESPSDGILKPPRGKPVVTAFYTPQEAKAIAQQQGRRA